MAGHTRRAARAGSAIQIRFIVSTPNLIGRAQVSARAITAVKLARTNVAAWRHYRSGRYRIDTIGS
jgi:hypothetical protein